MEKNHLFEGEEIILQSDNKLIVLTTRRIRYNNSRFGKAHIVSMLLEKVSSVEVRYRSRPTMILLGILFIVGGIAAEQKAEGAMGAGLFIGALFIAIYLFTHKHIVTIASCGGAKINFHTRGMSHEKLMNFINQIELAKSTLVLKN